MQWFKHFSSAHNSESLDKLLNELGFDGYGRYWRLLEFLCELFDGDSVNFTIHKRTLRDTLRFRSTLKLDSYLVAIGLQHGYNVIVNKDTYEIEAPILLELQSRDYKKARSKRAPTAPKNKIKSKEIDKEKKETKSASVENSNPNLFSEIVALWNRTHGQNLNKRYAMPSGIDMQNYKITQGYLPDLESWRNLFEKCEGTKLMGTDENFKCSWFGLGWLFKNENAANVINGQWEKITVKSNDSGKKNYTDAEIDKILTGK